MNDAPLTPPSPIIGAILDGKYRLERTLAAGAMGAVYEGRHLGLGRRVAIKFAGTGAQLGAVVGEARAQSVEAWVARFYREARIASTLESDYIVQVFDVGQHPIYGVFMVLEYLEGEDLEARLTREGRLNVATAVTLLSHLARGLSKAHARGIVHRDLKPANVFLCSRDAGSSASSLPGSSADGPASECGTVAKLLDFGVSKVVAAAQQEDLNGPVTEFDLAVGTPYYMAPEQAATPAEVDQRADVFALGAILFEMLAGRAVFDTNAVPAERLLSHILLRRAPSLSTVAPWVPAPLAGLVDELLSHDRDARPRNANRVLERLSVLYPNMSLPVPTVILPPPSNRGAAVRAAVGGGDDTQRAYALADSAADGVAPTTMMATLPLGHPAQFVRPMGLADSRRLAAGSDSRKAFPEVRTATRDNERLGATQDSESPIAIDLEAGEFDEAVPQIPFGSPRGGRTIKAIAWLSFSAALAIGMFCLGRISQPQLAAGSATPGVIATAWVPQPSAVALPEPAANPSGARSTKCDRPDTPLVAGSAGGVRFDHLPRPQLLAAGRTANTSASSASGQHSPAPPPTSTAAPEPAATAGGAKAPPIPPTAPTLFDQM